MHWPEHLRAPDLHAFMRLVNGWRPGAVIDRRYRLVERIGEGGMGEVWRAERLSGGGSCCLKSLSIPRDPELLARFEREGEAQARVDAHPNVTRVHALGSAEGRPYLVIDFADGGDLRDRLKAGGPLEPTEAAAVVRDLCAGLAHVHAQGVLHRDLKPANVLFANGTPQLTDFGIAKVLGAESLTATGAILGTPAYMAPEQFQGAGDERADVYGLGAILYHCLTGQPPFRGSSPLAIMAQVVNSPPAPPEKLRPGLPPGLTAICRKTLEKDPEQRFPSAVALGEALSGWLERPDRGGLGAPAMVAAVVIVLMALIVGVGLLHAPTPTPASASASGTPLADQTPRPVRQEPAPTRRPSGDALALDDADRAELERIRLRSSALKDHAWSLFVLPSARRLRTQRRNRAAVSLYREILRRGCPPSHLRQALQGLSELLLAYPGHEAEVRRCVVESAVRGHAWALKALVLAGRDPDWKRVFPDLAAEVSAAALKAYASDEKGNDLGAPEPALRIGQARRRLLAFLVLHLEPPKEVRELIALGALTRPGPSEAGLRVHTAAEDLLRRTEGRATSLALGLISLAAANLIDAALVSLARCNAEGNGVSVEPAIAVQLLLTGASRGRRRCLRLLAQALHGELSAGAWASRLIKDPTRRRPELALRCLAQSRALSGPDLRLLIDRLVEARGLKLPEDTRVDWASVFAHCRTNPWTD